MKAENEITIINGDCFAVMKTMPDKSVDMVFTSPPHNRKRNDKYEEYEDTVEDYFTFLKDAITESIRVSRGHVIFNIQKNYYNKSELFRIMGHFHDKIVEVIIWEKSNPMPAAGKAITNAYEFFIVFGDGAMKSNTTYTKNVITTAVNSSMPKEHKAVMKQDVADWFIEKFTKDGDIVLDPFFGLGTTGAAALKYGRKCIGIELSSAYCDMARAIIHVEK